ncbi:MAG: DUF4446 family protein [Sporichthyaceae bacterium]
MSNALSLAALGIGTAGCLLAVGAQVRFSRLRRDCQLLQGGAERSSFIVAAARTASELERLRIDVGGLHHEFENFRGAIDESIRRVAVHRYDAFGEMGGRLSWSVALLDETGDGVVLTALVGRTDTRCYAKAMRAGAPEARLSPEEQQVVSAALRPTRAVTIPSPTRQHTPISSP